MFEIIVLVICLCLGGDGGVVPEVDVCRMCEVEGHNVRCDLGLTEAKLIIRCTEARTLWVSERTFIMSVVDEGHTVEEMSLGKTTLTCEDVEATVVTLNGEKCDATERDAANPSDSSTTTTTTTKKYPFPVPWPLPRGEMENPNSTSSTSSATATATMTTTTAATTTLIVVVTAGIRVGQTIVIVTVAVAFTVLGTFVYIRCRRRRIRRAPLQVPEVSSTSGHGRPSTLGHRRSAASSYESVELFAMGKRD